MGTFGRTQSITITTAAQPGGYSRQVLDNGTSASECAIADLSGDDRPDLVCIGARTSNLRWYENVSE